jgi:hypothetical protein
MFQQQRPSVDPHRPMAAQAKWWIVGIVFLILGAWELAFHLWMMDLPMVVGHRLNALVGGSLVAGVVLVTFRLLQEYEQRLAAALEEVREKNEALRALEAERDSRLVDLARDLSLTIAEVVERCEVALQLPTAHGAPEALAAVRDRAGQLGAVARAMVELKQHGTSLTRQLSPILEEYERARMSSQPPRGPVLAQSGTSSAPSQASQVGGKDTQ